MNGALQTKIAEGVLHVCASGTWSIGTSTGKKHTRQAEGSPQLEEAEKAVQQSNYTTLALETEGVEAWDSSLLAMFSRLARTAKDAGKEVDTHALPEDMGRLLALSLSPPSQPADQKDHVEPNFLEIIGQKTLNTPGVSLRVINFLGAVAMSMGRFVTGQASVSRRDMWRVFRECGVDALPIVSLTSLLLGLILAFVGSIQLRNFGAEVYTADLVGIAMFRVMGPVLTGIVLSGRTGASFAAVIGSMQVNEEVDALVTFGIDPVDFLVLPRVLGLAIMTPLLAVYADLMGVLGGFIVSTTMMNISPEVYIDGTITSMKLSYFWIGLFHAFVFGFVVSLAGCYQGMRSSRSAEGVGGATTSAVVNSIVGIIISTSIITIVLTVIDL